jgi:hypothetical protein
MWKQLSAVVLLLGSVAAIAADPDPGALRRGEFLWHPEIAAVGPVVVVVSLQEQRAYVYRNGVGIGLSTISSGRRGHETPPGVFTILQKQIVHFSDKYDDAPMPYMERLTWDGVAMHAGTLPGYPASHGCIRLPAGFARALYEVTSTGVTVVVADRHSPPALSHPALLAPVDSPNARFNFAPVATTPVSVVVSLRDRKVYEFRAGERIAQAPLEGAENIHVGGSILYVMGFGSDGLPSRLDPDKPRGNWSAYAIPTRNAPAPDAGVAQSLRLDDAFAKRLYSDLIPGSTVLLTDLPGIRATDAEPERIMESNAH